MNGAWTKAEGDVANLKSDITRIDTAVSLPVGRHGNLELENFRANLELYISTIGLI